MWHAEDSSGRAAGGPGVVGVIVQLGGQTPLGLARRLKAAGVPIVGTSPESIHLAEDRGAFGELLAEAGLRAPAHGTATSFDEAKQIADEIGYPVLVRPSYVLGGRGMEIVYDDATLRAYITRATDISPEHPVLVDRFLDDAIEIDVDALVRRGRGGVPRRHHGAHRGGRHPLRRLGLRAAADHAGVGRRGEGPRLHRGDRPRGRGAGPAQRAVRAQGRHAVRAGGEPAGVAHRAVRLEGDRRCRWPRRRPGSCSARRSPSCAPRACCRRTGDGGELPPDAPIAVKEAVLPFKRFRTTEGKGVDSLLGPEMKSTGEVMGIDTEFGHAFAKSQAAAYGSLPTGGKIFVTVANRDKRGMIFPVKRLADLGLRDRRHGGHGRGAAPPRRRLRDRRASTSRRPAVGGRRQAGRGVADRVRRGGAGHQHAAGQRRPDGRVRDPQRRRRGGHPVHHDRAGRGGGGDGHRGADPGRDVGAAPAGAARWPASLIRHRADRPCSTSVWPGPCCSASAAATRRRRTSGRFAGSPGPARARTAAAAAAAVRDRRAP